MKKCIMTGILVGLVNICSATPLNLKTIDGTVYENVTITQKLPHGLRILHSKGAGMVLFEDLPPAIQRHYNYNPDSAKEALVKHAEAEERAAQRLQNIKILNTIKAASIDAEITILNSTTDGAYARGRYKTLTRSSKPIYKEYSNNASEGEYQRQRKVRLGRWRGYSIYYFRKDKNVPVKRMSSAPVTKVGTETIVTTNWHNLPNTIWIPTTFANTEGGGQYNVILYPCGNYTNEKGTVFPQFAADFNVVIKLVEETRASSDTGIQEDETNERTKH